MGIGPTVVGYEKLSLKSRDANNCAVVRGFRATWISGAHATTAPTLTLCGGHSAYNISLSRDALAPGLDKDLEFAIKIATANSQQRQAAAAEAAAAFQFTGILQNALPTSCTSMQVGNSIQTNCR